MKKKCVIVSIIMALLLSVSCFMIGNIQLPNATTEEVATRTVNLKEEEVDYQSILNEFENSTLETEGLKTTFVGYKSLDLTEFVEIDNLSETQVESAKEASVKYQFSYDYETNIVTLSAEMANDLGEIYIEELTGDAFVNADGNIDAIIEMEDEYILLSEMQDAGMIANCGWFSKLVKKVVKATVAAVAVATVATVVVASFGAGAGAVIAVGAVAGAIAGGGVGAYESYKENGKVNPVDVLCCAVAGGAAGALTGWLVGTIKGALGKSYKCKFGGGSFNSSKECLNYHFRKHGAEVGARTASQYSKMAQKFASNVLKSGTAPVRAVQGATPNVMRYVMNGKYIHMAVSGKNVIIVSFGLL